MNFRRALLRRMEDFCDLCEGKLGILNFDATARIERRTDGNDQAGRTTLLCRVKKFLVIDIANLRRARGIQASNTFYPSLSVAKDATAHAVCEVVDGY